MRAEVLKGLQETKAKGPTEEKAFLDGLGTRLSPEALEALPPSDLYLEVGRHYDASNLDKDTLAFRKRTRIVVASVKTGPPGQAVVRLRTLMPEMGRTGEFIQAYELRKLGQDWKVMREMRELGTQPGILAPK